MAMQHKIRTQYPLPGVEDGIEIEITFSFNPSRSATRLQPPEWANADVRSVRVVEFDGELPEFLREAIEQWADAWLDDDEGFDKAQETVASDLEAAREFAADLRADR